MRLSRENQVISLNVHFKKCTLKEIVCTSAAEESPLVDAFYYIYVTSAYSVEPSAVGTRQKVAHEVFGSRTPAIKMMLMVFPASGAMMEISGRNEVKEFFRVCPAVHAIEHAQRPRLFARPTGLLLEPESIPVSEFTSCRAPPRARIYSWLLLEPESIPVSELTSCRAPPRARIYSWLIPESESIPVSEFTSCRAHPRVRVYSGVRETHRIQGLVYLFTLQGSGQAPLWYTPEKITVPKTWFTGSTCLALASSLEYILEVFLFTFQLLFRV
ncbi:hypothetical protein EVAR_65599_1 [Eumeta japonica]|uniref:Uncharacterized protein n=1 Tax=Eumeta variegata TaxID=151549 RepID=A0A4C2A126_EUMVA|nr:hypothetical protein EVAR_65599_1 [Eumeta japonica]